MKHPKTSSIFLVFLISGCALSLNAQVKITDGPVLTLNPNSLLELESTNKGLLIPRIAIDNLSLPAPLTAPVPVGMIVYSLGGSITDGFYYWNGTSWIPFSTGTTGQWTTNGTSIYYNTGNVGIGTAVPAERLEVNGNIKTGDTNSGTIRATKELVLRQDGDVYGPSILRLRNRNEENGAIFETIDVTYTLIDFIFRNYLHQRNIRLESRASYARTGAPSFHLGGINPDNPTLSLGDNYAAFSKRVRIGDYVVPLTELDVNGQITLRSGASAGAVLVSDANGTGTWTNPGTVYSVPVTKSVSSTLLKTETVVLASGDITLTLPVVTIADDGLAITVKNTGNYTDLITVVPETGKTIDADTASILTRWRARTFVATGSNWIRKERETRADNLFDVGTAASFATIAEVVEFLHLHMAGPSVVRLGGGTFTIDATQTINLPYPVTFQGISFGETTIEADAGVSGNPLFICETECYFKMLTFNAVSSAPGNDAIHFAGSGEYYEVKDAYIVGFNRGIVATTDNESWIFEADFEDCTGAGIEIAAGAASGGTFKVSECDFIGCATGISLLSGVSETVSVMNCTFYNTPGGSDTGILYNPGSFTSFEAIFITNTAWNDEGTYIGGFDFTRSDGRDAEAFIESNAGIGDMNPHCKINVVNNSLTTTCTTANAWYKINWTNTSSSTCKFTINNNLITYQPSNSKDLIVHVSGNVSVNSNNRVITVGIVKNGVTATRYGETSLRITTANQPFQFSTVIFLEDVQEDDYFELHCSSVNSGDIARFQDVNILVESK